MPEPSPQLIDRVARAIRLELHGGNDSLNLLSAPLAAAAITRYQRAARAALAAMPQPIGYGIVVNEGDLVYALLAHSEQAARDWSRADAALTSVPVALVPVEGTPA